LSILPNMIIHFDVGREKSVQALEKAMESDQIIFLTTQKNTLVEMPNIEDTYEYGTISKVKQLLRLPGKTIRVLVEGMERGRILENTLTAPYLEGIIEILVEPESKKGYRREEALRRKAIESFEEYAALAGRISPETIFSIISTQSTSKLSDLIVGSMNLKVEQKQTLLEELDPVKRITKLLPIIVEEIQILELEKDISSKVKGQIDDMQKKYYLKEQLRVIKEELGEPAEMNDEVDEYRKEMENRVFPAEVKEKLDKEIDRLKKMNSMSAESTVLRTYIEWLIGMPWEKRTEEVLDLKNAREVLERDHYGLTKVKERIVEYIAARKMSKGFNAPILCLVGPPGVGKTSIVKSIAEAVNRNYVRMSLGGIRDEAEIRGHRRTYIGSMPGRIAKAIKQAESINPLILFDEVDKMGNDFRGDPASAMLEVLDAEQNYAFRDHYLEVSLDLSQVMFITTANTIDTIPRPLLDRMEIIEVSGYTGEEKLHIAKNHLIPKQFKKHGLKNSQLKIKDDALMQVIQGYTMESGVRSLEREIASLCRKVATHLIEENRKSITISKGNLHDYLGPEKYSYELAFDKDEVGIVRGLAWTYVGGDTLSIEVNVMPGTGNFELTGQLGDVMKESAKAALGYIRSKTEKYGIDEEFYKNKDIHIHIPEGAVPKDGPSAGITLATAIISALTNIPVKKDVAMTGEITLRGRVLPIGGLKEKLTAARRAAMKVVIIPWENKKDLVDVPEAVLKDLTVIPVSQLDQVLDVALTRKIKNKETVKNGNDKDKLIIPTADMSGDKPDIRA
ncbi:MAG: endopeptidase La, partial [Clostridia bacterium]|nr:endopeptidase La [Clostridia bacterium]